ncbi:putative protein TPRXL [Papaver somniferum]|uniref:putative protein TPRXL n=1 Tax=Papaver somniferum TaxID=3469 RepID=UPI000E6F6331|nr:putative protein TPRXL [Papaver somniferum]
MRAKPGVFVGYPYGHKGYKVYDLETKLIYTSRDDVFYETMFPFSNENHSSTLPSPKSIPSSEYAYYDSILTPYQTDNYAQSPACRMSTPCDTAPQDSSSPEHINVTLQQHTSCSTAPTASSSPANLSPIPQSTSSPATSANSTQHPIADTMASSTESDPSRSPTVSSHKIVSDSSPSPETVLAPSVQNS